MNRFCRIETQTCHSITCSFPSWSEWFCKRDITVFFVTTASECSFSWNWICCCICSVCSSVSTLSSLLCFVLHILSHVWYLTHLAHYESCVICYSPRTSRVLHLTPLAHFVSCVICYSSCMLWVMCYIVLILLIGHILLVEGKNLLKINCWQ